MNARAALSLRPLYKYPSLPRETIIPLQKRSFSVTPGIMAKFDINSKVKLNSGYEIPILGYGMYYISASSFVDSIGAL